MKKFITTFILATSIAHAAVSSSKDFINHTCRADLAIFHINTMQNVYAPNSDIAVLVYKNKLLDIQGIDEKYGRNIEGGYATLTCASGKDIETYFPELDVDQEK